MNQKIVNLTKTTKRYLTKHSPEILTGIGIAGMISSIILAVKATPEAMELIAIREEEELRKNENFYKLGKIETIKTAWKPYVPVVGTAIMSAACIICGNTINTRRNAALATAYALSEQTLLTYRDKVIETIGENKEKKIRDEISQDMVNKKRLESSQVIITQKGDTLFLDTISGRYFKSDIEKIRKIVNELNRRMNYENYVSLNDFYYELGLETLGNGSDLGWNIADGLIELYFSACLTENDEPCVVINYMSSPKYGYDKIY